MLLALQYDLTSCEAWLGALSNCTSSIECFFNQGMRCWPMNLMNTMRSTEVSTVTTKGGMPAQIAATNINLIWPCFGCITYCFAVELHVSIRRIVFGCRWTNHFSSKKATLFCTKAAK